MKTKILSIVIILLMAGCSAKTKQVQAPADSTVTWDTLEQQAGKIVAHVQARDIPSLHQLNHAVTAKIAGLQKAVPSLPTDRKQRPRLAARRHRQTNHSRPS